MAALTTQPIVKTGLEATYASAAGGGDTFTNSGNEFVHIVNGDGSDMTLTIVSSQTVDGLAVADRTVVVSAGESRFVGPFKTATYGSTVSLTYSSVTSLTLAILSLTAEQ